MAAAPTDAHRSFLQALLARGIVEAPEAERLRRLCCQRHQVGYVNEQLDDFIGALNVRLQPLSMEIRKGTAEENGKTYFALVNLAETDITKMASDFSENELELFKKTMDLILLAGNGFASSTEILNLADQLKPKKMRKVEVEQVLQQLVQKKKKGSTPCTHAASSNWSSTSSAITQSLPGNATSATAFLFRIKCVKTVGLWRIGLAFPSTSKHSQSHVALAANGCGLTRFQLRNVAPPAACPRAPGRPPPGRAPGSSSSSPSDLSEDMEARS